MAGGVRIHHMALGAALLALGVAALIFWLGNRAADDVLRLVAEGRVVRAEEVSRHNEDRSVTRTLAYFVAGRRYIVTSTSSSSEKRPVFDEDPIPVPRLGPEDVMHVVYLPSDPAIAYMRYDLKEGRTPIYFATGLFTLIGLFFCAAGLAFRRSK